MTNSVLVRRAALAAPCQTASSSGVGFPRLALALTLLLLAAAAALPAQTPSPSVETLRRDFLNPPDAAKPMVRWWWFGPAVVKPEILTELQQMKADGIQGAELAFVYPEVLDDPAKDLKNLPFLSPAMLDAVRYAQTEGRRLGLRIDVTLCSGWPYGGPAITLQEAVTRMLGREVAVPANAASVATPRLAEGDTILAAFLVNGTPTPPPSRLRAAPATAPAPSAPTWDAASAKPFTPTGDSTAVAAGDSPRVALFFIQSHTRQQVKRAAVDAEGFVLDPFSHAAVATHLKAVGEPLLSAFAGDPPYAIFSDSLEAYGADWTPNLPAEFKKRRGYDLMQHLPELLAGGTIPAETVRHDYGKTLTELVNENYLTQINNWAIAHRTKFRSQTYGEPAVSFSSQNLAGLAEGEGPQWRQFSTLRWASSANHVFNHDVTSGETFTWLHSPVFRATPLDMKAEADIDFVMGENQLMFHGWPYSPPDHEVPEPGWSLYAAASFNNHNPWHPVMPEVTRYIARMSYLMRQGQPANQVAILLPTDDAWARFSPGHSSVTGLMGALLPGALQSAIMAAGYNVDYIDAEAIDKVGLGAHQILLLPPTERIPVATLKKIAASGIGVIAFGRVPSLDPEGKPLDFRAALPNAAVATDEPSLTTALRKAAAPDFRITATAAGLVPARNDEVGFIRRKLPNADIYFVANTTNQPWSATIALASTHKYVEAWDPDRGAAASLPGNSISLALAPYESRVFIFSDTNPGAPPQAEAGLAWDSIRPGTTLADLSSDWHVTFPVIDKSVIETTLTDWIADPSTKNYSGVATYSRDFTVSAPHTGPVYLEVTGGEPLPMPRRPGGPPELLANGLPDPRVTRTGPGMHAYYDPPIHEAALVTVNGQAAGALWHPPYRLDVSKLLKPGQNRIEIKVYNTALNAWAALPPHDYQPLIAKYGDRFQMQDLDQVRPIPSGMLGQIHLVTEAK